MKKDARRIAVGIVFIVLGAVIALGPQYFFKICEQGHGHGGVTNCRWSAQAEIGVGAVIALLGVTYVLTKGIRALAALSLALTFNGLLAFAIPNFLVGMCENDHMRCRLVTLPALNILSAVIVIAAVSNAAWLFRKSRRDGNVDAPAQTERT
jgi:hypothetical protein